jgi:phospholipid/cholesterol/gamma-HCH transport system substrate-binding protein
MTPPAPDPAPAPRRDPLLFLISGTLLAVALVVAIGRQQNWGQPRVTVALRAPTADGLQPGMSVRISGLPVGHVDSFAMQPDASVRVQLTVLKSYRPLIGPASRAYQGQDGFVGERFLGITPQPRSGNPNGPLTLPYEPAPQIGQLLREVSDTRLQVSRALQQTSGLASREIPMALGDFRTAMGSINSLSRSTSPQLSQTLGQARQTALSVEATSDEARALLRANHPLLSRTLREIYILAVNSNRLMRVLGGLGVFEPETSLPGSSIAPPVASPSPPPTRAPLSR